MAFEEAFRNSQPDSWRLCRGPANWFTFRCPEEVDVRQNQTLIELRLKALPEQQTAIPYETEERAVLSVVAWWDEAGSGSGHPATANLALLFPQVLSLQLQPSLNISASNEVWSGNSRRPAAGRCWLARIFRRRHSYEWRLWMIRSRQLTIVATIQSAERRPLDRQFVAVCERILGTLEIAEQPAWPPDVFLKQVMELARQYFPLLQTSVARGFSLRLGQSEIGLTNFYRMYLQQPEKFRRIVLPGLTTVVRLQELGPDQLTPSLEQIRDRILPMLSSDAELRADQRVRMPWVGGLSVGYVVDQEESYRYVHQRMLNSWNLSLDELHELAIDNLQQYVVEHPLEVTLVGDDGAPRMLMPVKADAYNCSRILDPVFHGRLRELFGPELIVGVPNRDFFVAVSMKEPQLIEQVRARVSEDYTTMHHPLTRRLLVISADGVSEYCES